MSHKLLDSLSCLQYKDSVVWLCSQRRKWPARSTFWESVEALVELRFHDTKMLAGAVESTRHMMSGFIERQEIQIQSIETSIEMFLSRPDRTTFWDGEASGGSITEGLHDSPICTSCTHQHICYKLVFI